MCIVSLCSCMTDAIFKTVIIQDALFVVITKIFHVYIKKLFQFIFYEHIESPERVLEKS